MTELLLLLGVAVLVALNGFFVAAEFAFVRTREGRIELMRDEGKRAAPLVLRQIDKIDEYLSACQRSRACSRTCSATPSPTASRSRSRSRWRT